MSDVSVIIPTWNRAATLEKVVRSALAQTLPPLEVLVCDDGSTDDSREIIEAICDSRVKWIEGPRGGRPAIPRNRGIRESRGEWLAFLDDDDEWLPEKLERQIAAIKASGGLACCSNALRFIPGRGSVGPYLTATNTTLTFNDLLKVNQVICSSAIIHNSLVSSVLGFPEDEHLKAWEDYALWLRIATQTNFTFVAEPMLVYLDDAASSVRNEQVNVCAQRRAVFNNFKRWGKEHGVSSSYLRSATNQWLSDLLSCATDKLMQRAGKLKKTLLS